MSPSPETVASVFGFITVAWVAYFAFRIVWAVFGPALEVLAQ